MPKARLVVLLSGSGSNLQAIIDRCADGGIPGEVVAVISNVADAYGLQRARDAGIATGVLSHRDYPDRPSFDRALMQAIDAHAPDLVILAGFMRILSDGFVRHYHGRLLNIHPSLLPLYPGLHTHQRALEAGDAHAGATVHFVTEELDGGPAVLQARVPVQAGDTAQSLAARVLEQEHQIYPLAVRWFCEGRLSLDPRGALLDGHLLPPGGHAFAGC